MSEVFSQHITLQDLLEQGLRIALDVVNAENGSVLLADTDNRTLVFYHSIGQKPVPSGTAVLPSPRMTSAKPCRIGR